MNQLEQARETINRVDREAGGTHAMLSVTDAELLARTGGK